MAWTNPSTRTTGTLITASIWNTDLVDNLSYLKGIADAVDGYFVIRKTADESVNNSTTFQSDDELLFSIAASAVVDVDTWILATGATATADIKFQWSVPAGCVYYMASLGTNGTTTWAWSGDTVTGTPVALSTTTQSFGIINDTTNPTGIYFHTKIVNSTNAGTCTLQWAQNSAVAANVTVKANSSLIIHKLT